VLMSQALYLNQVCVIAQSASPPPPEVSEANRAVLRRLDHARSEYQLAIFRVLSNAVTMVCGECKGRCCRVKKKNTNFFYAIDFWLRYYTASPIQNQNENHMDHPARVWPRQLFHFGLGLIRNTMRWIHDSSSSNGRIGHRGQMPRRNMPDRFPIIPDAPILCMYLSDRGCTLEPAQRPIICIVYTCKALRQALDNQALERMIENVRGLKRIHGKVLRLLRREGKLGRYSGWTRLAIPLISYDKVRVKRVGTVV